jgi:hypothetical protein
MKKKKNLQQKRDLNSQNLKMILEIEDRKSRNLYKKVVTG